MTLKTASVLFALLLLVACAAPAPVTRSESPPEPEAITTATPELNATNNLSPPTELDLNSTSESPEQPPEVNLSTAQDLEPIDQPTTTDIANIVPAPEISPPPQAEPPPPPPPQPLIVDVEQLQLQYGNELQQAEIVVQSLGIRQPEPELLEEDRTPEPELAAADTNTSDNISETNQSFAEPTQLTTNSDPTTPPPPASSTPPNSTYPQQVALLLEAELAFYEQRYADAFALRMEVARNSGDPRVTQEAYNSASVARDREAMSQALDLWLQQAPDSQAAHELRLVELLQSSQPLRALQSLEQLYYLGAEIDFTLPVAILIYPTESQVRALLDTYYRMAHQYGERSDIWGAVLMLRIYLINILDLQQRYAEAQAELQAIRSESRGWELIASEALYELELREARINARLLNDSEIDTWYQQALNRSPSNWQLHLQHLQRSPEPTDSARVLLLKLLGNVDNRALLDLRDLAVELEINATVAAIDFYLAERARVGNRQALANLAQIAENSGRLVLADEYLAQLYSDPNTRPAAYLSRLRLWLGNDQEDIARQIYRSVWEDQQLSQFEAAVIYARTLNSFQRYDKSLELLTFLLQQSTQKNELLLVRAESYMFRGDYALMEADLRRVIADAPDESAAYNTLGYVLADTNTRLKESELLINRALQIDPENPAYIDSLGWLAFRQGDLERARRLIEWSYRRWQDPEIIAHLGEIYWQLGETERALYLWIAALEEHPEHEALLKAITRITSVAEGADLYQHLVARLQVITSSSER